MGGLLKWGYDSPSLSIKNVIPTGIYFAGMGGTPPANFGVESDGHASLVAEVMTGETTPHYIHVGVAPNAELHSIGFGIPTTQPDIALALKRIAEISGGNVQAINMSFEIELQPFIEHPDGNSHLTQFVDWSARRHDVLYVVSWGNADSVESRAPQDNFNGITVAASEYLDVFQDSTYRRYAVNVNAFDGDATGERTSIDLLAPGNEVRLLGYNDTDEFYAGTSYAAPHVTGAAALLHQFREQQINVANPRFLANPHKHEVIKAVMLNSADKMKGVHGSQRTVLDAADQNWEESEAFTSVSIPLDDQMGAGHLNVRRAVQQYAPGEYDPGVVPRIGWDYGSIGGPGSIVEYVIDSPMQAGNYLAATITWDRRIESTGGNNYNAGDQFLSHGVANLDLLLMTKNGTNLITDTIWSSQSFEDNVEHIFFKFQPHEAGEYKLVVHHNNVDIGTPLATTNYAIAWWVNRTGDYDGNGAVGPEDYSFWQSSYGSTVNPYTGADGSGDGYVDTIDYIIWRNIHQSGGGALAAVPEPNSLILFTIAVLVTCVRSAVTPRRSRSGD